MRTYTRYVTNTNLSRIFTNTKHTFSDSTEPIQFLTPDMQDVYHLRLPFLYGLTHVSKVGSVFTTLAVSLERYFAVCKPLWIRIRRCHPAMYIVLVTVFAFGFNVPKFLEFEVKPPDYLKCSTCSLGISIYFAFNFLLKYLPFSGIFGWKERGQIRPDSKPSVKERSDEHLKLSVKIYILLHENT